MEIMPETEIELQAPLWRKRRCTDVPCLLIFGTFMIGWGFIAQFAWRYGDLSKLVAPTDVQNQKCGIDSDVLDKKYLFFFDLNKCIDPLVTITGCPTPQICVKECPRETFIWDTMKNQLSIEELKNRLVCRTDADKNSFLTKDDAQKAIDQERCARWYIKSAPFLNRCVHDIAPYLCEYMPTFLLQQRHKRHKRHGIASTNSTTAIDIKNNEKELQALALVMFSNNAAFADATNANANVTYSKCRQYADGEKSQFKEKINKSTTALKMFIDRILGAFVTDTQQLERVAEHIAEDILNSRYVVLVAVLCIILSSFIYIALMRWIVTPLLWSTIFVVLTGLLAALYFSIKQYLFYHSEATVPQHTFHINGALKNVLQEEKLWLYSSIIFCVLFTVLVLVLIALYKRITIALALIREGSKAVSSIKSTIFFPLFSWILLIAGVLFAVFVALHLNSIGENSFRMIRSKQSEDDVEEKCICEGPALSFAVGKACDPKLFQLHCFSDDTSPFLDLFRKRERLPCTKIKCRFVGISQPSLIYWLKIYNVFAFLWLSFFIAAFSDMVLAVAFSTWYWTFKKKDLPFFTLTKALMQTAFFHLGTIAFGSLIMAFCRALRLMLDYIDRKVKQHDNAVTRALMCCMKCFFALLESFLRFISKNAYIMCAIHGKNFCTSARDAFNLTMRNVLRVVTLGRVADFLFFMSKVLLSSGAGMVTYLIVSNKLNFIHYHAIPTVIVFFVSYTITSLFFRVYLMAVDTLFLCFLEDLEKNDGSPEKQYYMSKQLLKIVQKRNKS